MEEKPNPYQAPRTDGNRRSHLGSWIAIGVFLLLAVLFFGTAMGAVGSRNVASRDYLAGYVFLILAALSFLASTAAFVRLLLTSGR